VFDDYSPAELINIVERFAAQQDYRLSPAANSRLRHLFGRAYKTRYRNFGNARFARDIFEQAIANQATRLVSLENVTPEILKTVEPQDVPESA
jgi:hypothetical protein